MRSRSPGEEVLQRMIARNFDRSRRDANTLGALAALGAALGLLAAPQADAGNIYFVTDPGDMGPGTLRQLISDLSKPEAATGNTVVFDNSLVGSTITLTSGSITIGKPMYIQGPGRNLLTISGNHDSRIFYVKTNTLDQYTFISGLTLTAANAGAIHVGGAIQVEASAVYLNNSAVTASTAGAGGGIFAANSRLFVARSRVSGNSAVASAGGGISANFSSVTIDSSTISGNTAVTYGGGIYARNIASGNAFSVSKSTISGNRIPQPAAPALTGGGGLALKNASADLVELNTSTVAGNYAFRYGGGINLLDYPSAQAFAVRYSTIASNSSSSSGGDGIFFSAGVVRAVNTVVSGNFSTGGLSDLPATSVFYMTNCFVQTPGNATFTVGSSGSVFGLDPHLSALADHGGPTLTMLPAAGSAVIDKLPCPPSIGEQRGFGYSRCVNGLMDIGAVERQNPEDIVFRNGLEPI
jgi:predicted outer membrane repeat protein